ncbi:MAG: phosphohydrolase, partial [Psychroserpens sp.]|nr:phosphohydrolase [Psychroserpens sp.]
MNDWINKWYKNHALLYKVLLFLSTTFLIVYLFPKSGKFRYDFDKGKPWQSENLYAPFDFAIKKSADEIESEQREASEKSPVYFDLDVSVKPAVLAAYDKQFNSTFSDSSDVTNSDLYKIGESIINDLYSNGVLDEAYQYSADKTVILLSEQRQYGETQFSNLSALDAFKIKLASGLNERGLETYNTIMTSVFFDVIKPSLKRNLDFTQNALTERLNNISTVRGSIEKATLIISKGEIVEGNKYDILRSLEAEYKSQVWNESNYNLIVFAYALLVALALLMLLLFLR